MANRTPARGRFGVGANTGRASWRSPWQQEDDPWTDREGWHRDFLQPRRLAVAAPYLEAVRQPGVESRAPCLQKPRPTVLANLLPAGRRDFVQDQVSSRADGDSCARLFAKAEPAGNPTIAHLLRFETENGAVSLMEFLVHGRTDYRPSPRAREGAQSTDFQTLLIAAKCAGRVAEAACDIVLIRVSRLKKLNHGIGFGRTILNRVMEKTMPWTKSTRCPCSV